MSTEPQEVPEVTDPAEITAEAFPSLELVYELVPHSISWSLGRYEAGQNRLHGMLVVIPVLTFGAIGFVHDHGTFEPDAFLYVALGFFAAAMAVCVFKRTSGEIRMLDPSKCLDHAWKPTLHYRAYLTQIAGGVIEHNADACRRMGDAVRIAAALLAAEMASLVLWWIL